MRRYYPIVFVFIFLFSCNSSKQTTNVNHLTNEEKNDGWILLFDGKSTNGWHKYGNQPIGSGWKVKDNYLYLDTAIKDGGDIVTEEEYENPLQVALGKIETK